MEAGLGEVVRTMISGTESYRNTRGADITRSMETALENLRKAAEK
jgi:hypothetical protein